VRLDERRHEQVIHRRMIHRDLLIALRRADRPRAQLQPIQRALARQRRRQLLRFRQHREERIVPQLLVIVQVLVAQRQSIDPLPHQGRHRVRHTRWIAMILEAAREPVENPRHPVHLAQQHRAAIGRQRPAIKPRLHRAAAHRLKLQRPARTLCRHNGCLRFGM
jgi:hypothetical protein